MINLLLKSFSDGMDKIPIPMKAVRTALFATSVIALTAFAIYDTLHFDAPLSPDILRSISPLYPNSRLRHGVPIFPGEYKIDHPELKEREIVLETIEPELGFLIVCFLDKKTKFPEETRLVSEREFRSWNPKEIWIW